MGFLFLVTFFILQLAHYGFLQPCLMNQVLIPPSTCIDVFPFVSLGGTSYGPSNPQIEIADGGSALLTFASGALPAIPPSRSGNIFSYTFNVTNATSTMGMSCPLTLEFLATCDSALCDETSLFDDSVTIPFTEQIVDQAQIFINPADSFSLFFTSNACGCPATLDSDQFSWIIRATNNIGNGENCTFEPQVTLVDICNDAGDWTSVDQALPPGDPAVDGSICVCDEGFAGQNCQSLIQNLTLNTPIQTTLSQGEVQFFTFSVDTNGFNNIFLPAISTQFECPTPTRRIQRNCGGCSPAFPQFSSSRTQRFDLQIQTDSFRLSDFGIYPRECGCTDFLGADQWFMSLEIPEGMNCTYELTIETQATCDNSINAVSGCGAGTCVEGVCECPADGLVGFACDVQPREEIEVFNDFNGIFVEQFNVAALRPFLGYVTVAPLTNDRLTIQVNAPSGSNVLGLQTRGGQNASGTIFFVARWGEQPDFVFDVSPLNFPFANISVLPSADEETFDFFEMGPTIDFSIPINVDVPDAELHFAIYLEGIYNRSSGLLSNVNPEANENSNTLQVQVSFEDTFADVVNSLLIGGFGLFVVWICCCYCVCPPCFHFCAKCFFPELYKQDIDTPDDDYKEKDISENPIVLHLNEPNVLKVLLILLIGPFAIAFIFASKIPLGQLLDFLEQKIKDANIGSLQTIKIGQLPHPIHPLELVHIIRNLPGLDLTKDISIPTDLTSVDQLIELIDLPDGPIDIHVTSFYGFMNQLANVPEFDVIGYDTWMRIVGRLPKISLPLIQITKDIDIQATLERLRLELKYLPNIPLELVNGLKNMTPELEQLDVSDIFQDFLSIPIDFDVPTDIVKEIIEVGDIDIPNITALTDLSVEAKIKFKKKLTKIQAWIKFIKLTAIESLALLGRWFIQISLSVFTIGLIWSEFAEFTAIRDIIPGIDELQDVVDSTIGQFWGFILRAVDEGFEWLNFFVILSSWNCGGVLTMVTPFLFLFVAIPVWIFLQKDILLYFGIKLRIFSIAAKNGRRTFKAKVWGATAYVTTRLTILVMQATLFILAEAATTSFTSRTCSDVDFIATSLGKGIVAIFFLVFYGIFFFTFTGAPYWPKYENKSRLITPFYIIWDGLIRYTKMTGGIWNEDTVRGYNIVYRAERYNQELDQANQYEDLALTNPAQRSEKERAQFHERVMTLIAVSRAIVWIPLPLGSNLAKGAEYLNQAHVFVFPGEEKLRLLRPLWSRIVIWLVNLLQLPLVLAFIFSASAPVLGVLVASLLPTEAQRWIRKLSKNWQNLKDDLEFASDDDQEETELPSVNE